MKYMLGVDTGGDVIEMILKSSLQFIATNEWWWRS